MNSSTLPSVETSGSECPVVVDPYRNIKLFNFGLTICISAFGLTSNSLVVLVNRNTNKLSSTDVYITALAISDSVMILCLSIFAYRYAYRLMFPSIEDLTSSGVVALAGILLSSISQFVNTYIIVLLSLDRYIQVRHISLSKTWCTTKRAHVLLVANIISAVTFCLPRMWEYIPLMQHASISIDRCFGYYSLTHGIGMYPAYQLAYGFVMYVVVMYAFPLILLTFTSSSLISTIHKRTRWLRKIHTETANTKGNLARLKKAETNAIITLIIVTFAFIVFQIPDISLQFIWRLADTHGPTASIFSYQIQIINSSVNFIIYAISSNAFRKRLLKIIRCRNNSDDLQGNNGTMLGGHSAIGAANHQEPPVQADSQMVEEQTPIRAPSPPLDKEVSVINIS